MIGLALLAALAAQPGDEPQADPPAAAASDAAEAERLLGEMLLERFECARCHQLERQSVVQDRSCVDCHRAIQAGTLPAPPELLARWRGRLRHLLEVPSLRGVGGVLRAPWIEQYLLRPHELRRGLAESMPRLSIKPTEARAIAHALTGGKEPPSDVVRRGDAARGLALLESKGCTTCHAYTGAGRALGTTAPAGVDGERLARGMKLAPDLRATRERTTPALVSRLLDDPRALRPDALMPKVALAQSEKADVLAALFDLPVPLLPAREPPPRLPVLKRKVRFAEVQEAVLQKTCIHCHAEDSRNLGVGGPGSSGGFGYAGTNLVLTSYARVLAGSQRAPTLDPERARALEGPLGLSDVFGPGVLPPRGPPGVHRSVFRPVEEGPMKGVPLLVAQLRARQLEEAGEVVPGVVGMPLGLPALSPEALQLVESWVAQGRPQ